VPAALGAGSTLGDRPLHHRATPRGDGDDADGAETAGSGFAVKRSLAGLF
jgi:hypothetical protein